MTLTQPVLDLQLPRVARVDAALTQARSYPHLRYMGSKYRLLPALADTFAQLGGETALDPFTGSGVVSYLLKAQGFHVTSRDYLNFPVTLARASCVNQTTMLTEEDVARISSGENRDGRDFISRTYGGLYFTSGDLAFLDSAWSQIATMEGAQQDLAIASLVLAAARKQPRGVFTVTGLRYDDGRESLHLPLAEQFRRCVEAWNSSVFDGPACQAERGDVKSAEGNWDLVYLDPPYAPPRDDNDYIKRYWFLEGLSDYWQDGTAEIMETTRTKKLAKRATAFGSKRTIGDALAATLDQFSDSSIVLSYGSNAVPDLDTLTGLITDVKGSRPEVITLRHRYHFGTHASATRREAEEYILVAP
ncbi:DNA adenine methylase [Micrococcus sp.]|uniref:DNA adenine methylase n=1 Tax=Micrococcus sp. TaxID=1271 RepID=UPI002A912FF5|nr:DNA adenine methylase [Micrococcus sp.]MDY6056093.1 DNA adenine methylase [Micrococcus sp.]